MRKVIFLFCIFLMSVLSGCAAQQAYQKGQDLYDTGHFEEGLDEISNAHKLDPDNSEYRSQYYKLRDRTIFKWFNQANAAKNNSAWEEAGNYYKSILKIDPDNSRAKIGLNSLKTEEYQSQLLSDAKALFDKDDLSGANNNVRRVLAESPSHPEAIKLRKLIERKMASLKKSDEIFKSKLERPITIEFKDSPIKSIFDFISKSSGTNFLFDKDVRTDLRASLSVQDARIEDVVRFLLLSNQLEQSILNGNTLYIYPSTPQKLKEFQELKVKNFYLANASAKDVSAMLKSIVKTKDLYVDEKANLIVMRDTQEIIRVAERLVSAQDIAEPETILDVEVLEVGTSLLDTIGIQFPGQMSFGVIGAAGVPGTVTLPEFQNRNSELVNVSISDPALILNFLHQDGDTNLLGNPKIRVKNREKASIHIGEKVPVITNTTTSTGVISQSINYLEVGLKLDVEPTIYLENDVAIKVRLEVSSITQTIQNVDGSLTYQLGTRSANTVLRLNDGETQMLAGLISREERKSGSGVPWLGELPLIGGLFSTKTKSNTKTEVVLLITPRVVRNIVRPEAPIEEFSSGTESAFSLDKMGLNSAVAEKSKLDFSSTQGGITLSSEGNRKPEATSAVASGALPTSSVLTIPSSVHLSLESPVQAQPEKEFVVNISLAGSGVQKAFLDFSYDPSKFQVVSVDEGDMSRSTNGNTRFMQQVQDKIGHISLGLTGNEDMQDKGVVASITLKPLAATSGKTGLRIAAANLSGKAGQTLQINNLPAVILEVVK